MHLDEGWLRENYRDPALLDRILAERDRAHAAVANPLPGLVASLPIDSGPGRWGVGRGPNKTELAYGRFLENLRLDGRILKAEYEPEKLRLAGRTFYTPDYRVTLAGGSIEMHECKGFMRDDAAVKIKVAAEMYPDYAFRLVRKVKGGWEWRPVDRRGIGRVGTWEP